MKDYKYFETHTTERCAECNKILSQEEQTICMDCEVDFEIYGGYDNYLKMLYEDDAHDEAYAVLEVW